jgi:histone acetyltransferase
LSEADEDEEEDEEENKPLAARVAITHAAERTTRLAPGHRSGKKKSKKSKGHTAPTSLLPPTGQDQVEMNSKLSGMNGYEPKVKIEDKMDENQLTRLATGVTVDAGRPAPQAVRYLTSCSSIIADFLSQYTHAKPEKAAIIELRKGIIQITPVENDESPRSLVILTGLKTLFQKQLPKMPREYIARLVYDDNSKALAIIKRGYKVVGGICYRPFPHRGFAEIVFFATSSADQEKVNTLIYLCTSHSLTLSFI